ncbi:MAG TPA: hypothetical protein VI461_05635 [Chitinophagaceae bacterium]|nr:hypothetical protein [Chitinophagaceae bacterium]
MKIVFLILLSFFISQVMGQRLRDSLYGGKIKADTGKTLVSKDTSKYVVLQNETVSSQPGEKQTGANAAGTVKLDESMPDSLNKLFYSKQKQWKRFIETNTQIISQQADDNRKVKKGTYEIEVEYEIGLNGRVTTKGIACNPYNEFLILQVTELMKRPPVLSPPIYSDGKPRVLPAKQTITITKK